MSPHTLVRMLSVATVAFDALRRLQRSASDCGMTPSWPTCPTMSSAATGSSASAPPHRLHLLRVADLPVAA